MENDWIHDTVHNNCTTNHNLHYIGGDCNSRTDAKPASYILSFAKIVIIKAFLIILIIKLQSHLYVH